MTGGAWTFGWDIGGAHLKLAARDGAGAWVGVRQLACPLWQGLDRLAAAIGAAAAAWPLDAGRHRVTMSGEMCDFFPDRESGVHQILQFLAARFGAPNLRAWTWSAGLQPVSACLARDVASMNWHASASALAARCADAVFVDLGSTTADVIRIVDGRVVTQARDDRGRLASDELVYQGVARTPLMALASRVPYRGNSQGVAAEYFATMADVYRVLGNLPTQVDLHPSADGREKTAEASAARLARMVGDDLDVHSRPALLALAGHYAALQAQRLREAIGRVEGHGARAGVPLVGAGVGCFVLEQLAASLGRPWRSFGEALGVPPHLQASASDHAPAAALAALEDPSA